MRKAKAIISLLVTLLLIFSYLGIIKLPQSPPLAQSKPQVEGIKALPTLLPSGSSIPAQVIKVVDGDTITVMQNNIKQTIRIIGIDTPETVDPRKPVQCYGKAASNRAKELLRNKIVYLESDATQGDKDKYGRLLRFVFINGTDDYGLGTIEEGFAHEYTYNVPYKYQTEYKNAQTAAMNAKVGLWADNACVTPSPVK